jgi:indole-3-glycerol phosphate synthase
MNLLEEIVLNKKQEVSEARERFPVAKLEKSKLFGRNPFSLADFILSSDKTGIIAEFKRKSPSKGIINSESTLEEVTTGYFRSGASGLSILTDSKFFGGSNADLKRARELNSIPILRKDFIIDEYQIIEAKAMGADAVLLIAAILHHKMTKELARFARSLGLQVLLEVHEPAEIEYLNEFVNIIGVNNRDLKTFHVDTERSVELACAIPSGFIKISESGINSAFIVKKLRSCGYQGFLIGESFMRSPEPAKAFADFVELIITNHD